MINCEKINNHLKLYSANGDIIAYFYVFSSLLTYLKSDCIVSAVISPPLSENNIVWKRRSNKMFPKYIRWLVAVDALLIFLGWPAMAWYYLPHNEFVQFMEQAKIVGWTMPLFELLN